MKGTKLALVFGMVLACGVVEGQPTPPAPTYGPSDTTVKKFSLLDIWTRLTLGTAGGRTGAFAEPAAGPTAPTMKTTDDIMTAAPAIDNTVGATAADVAKDKTFWGLRTSGGVWGRQVGELQTRTLSDGSTTVAAGYYAATTLDAVDTDLTTANIRAGVNIFGIAGATNVVDTTTGTAAGTDILSGKKAWVAGTEVTGSIVTQLLSASSTAVAAGYYAATNLATVDTHLISANILTGASIFGVAGNVIGATGNAVAAEVVSGKTFSNASGAGVTGTRPLAPVPVTGQTVCYSATNVVVNCQTGSPSPAGQDGQWLKGVAYPNPRFTDNGNGTVTDNLTGLVWLKNANCAATLGGVAKTTTLTWANALTWGNALYGTGTPVVCGLTDGSVAGAWRLPNVREQQSLIDYNYFTLAVPNTGASGKWTEGNPFTNVQSDYYWTSSTYVRIPAYAWVVGLYDGDVLYVDKTSLPPFYVWPVRGGQ